MGQAHLGTGPGFVLFNRFLGDCDEGMYSGDTNLGEKPARTDCEAAAQRDPNTVTVAGQPANGGK